MRMLFAAVAALCLTFAPATFPALAQTATVGAATVATPSAVPAVNTPAADTIVVTEDTSVVLPYGAWLSAFGDLITNYAVPLLLTVAAGFVATLPGYVRVIVGTFLTDRNMRLAIQYAINSVAGAAKDKELTVDVGNRVIATAAQYFVNSVPGWLTKWLGGEAAIPNKVLSRVQLEPSASAMNVSKIKPGPKGTALPGDPARHR